MVKHLEDLDEVQKEIIKTLSSGRSRGLTTQQIREAMVRDGYQQVPMRDVKDGIGELIDYGSVRGYTKKGGDRMYSLSRGLGSGGRNQARLMGNRNLFSDTYKFFQRIFGAIFVLFGLGFMIYLISSITGNVVSNSYSQINFTPILSLLLMLIGGTLLFVSSKK